ncbi:endonuclease/exonuclease/phosphatase family domain-containing protein 1-like isoform X2 [Penaeus chinensis]|uniref:endonuclease/exonuclease/phosphatase family domain-containing protein 1-like isoform X2 n=1 Tax=Penaeus chinensis TaxID=139456 RepID=UPI001FB733A0|nr:endonuclease/exonuclease/phosphatase family domain-containing protein 1-like isoform X2 [Penaeus chinensis]
MGQCTSGELPPANQDAVDGEIVTERRLSLAENISEKTSNRKFLRRRSSTTSWVSSKFGRGRKARDLSAAFNLLDYDAKINLVNINTAPEEELMTLPGVTRSVAKNIVDYRNTIGGFRRVEDLALVSGIGANKLQHFKNEITVKKKSSSRSSSRTQSVDSLSCESIRSQRSQSQSQGGRSIRGSPVRVINVNTASIFELMNVHGMNQEMAANIVEHRERKGPFKSIDDLVKVRGINSRVLSILKVYLTLNDLTPSSPPLSDVTSVASYSKVYQRNLDGKLSGHASPCHIVFRRVPYLLDIKDYRSHRRTHSAPLDSDDTTGRITNSLQSGDPRMSVDFYTEIFELLSVKSERPIVRDVFQGQHNGRPAIRIATWNLQQLTKEKMSNPGVLEVICRTVLENGFSILAIQEVGSKDVLEKICSELNQSSLRRVREWGGPKGEWRWQVSEEPAGRMFQGSEYAAFIYNVRHNVQLLSACLLNVHNNNNKKANTSFTRKPYLGYFKANNLDFVVVSLHIKAVNFNGRKDELNDTLVEVEDNDNSDNIDNNESPVLNEKTDKGNSQLGPLVTVLKEKLTNERDIVLLGDFNMPPDNKAFDVLRETSYTNIVPADSFTNISAKNNQGTSCYDNIWLNPHTRSVYTGNWGVVREGMSHLAIPRGWLWGGMVSNHCPVYCDLYSNVSPNSGQQGSLQLTRNMGEVLRDE